MDANSTGKPIASPPTGPSSTKATNQPATTSVSKSNDQWFNSCRRCNDGQNVDHDPGKCCIACRNFFEIDNAAKSLAASILKDPKTLSQERFKNLGPILTKFATIKANNDTKAVSLQVAYMLAAESQEAYKGKNDADSTNVVNQMIDAYESEKKIFARLVEDETKWIGALTQAVVRLSAMTLNDPVDRARFLFTWVAHSLNYDENKLNAYTDDKKSQVLSQLNKKFPGKNFGTIATRYFDSSAFRRPMVTFLNGFEVCMGFADLYQVMLNSAASSNACITIIGWKKDPGEKSGDDSNSHRWNAITVDSASPPKIVDVTCGYGSRGIGGSDPLNFDPSWFTRPNLAFARTHCPDKDQDQGDKKWGNGWCLPSSTPYEPIARDFWSVERILLANKVGRMMIDESSVKPDLTTIPWIVQTFSVKPSCEHIDAAKMPSFALFLRDAEGEGYNQGMKLIWPVYDKTRRIYEAKVDLGISDYKNMVKITWIGFVAKSASATTSSLLTGITKDTFDAAKVDPAPFFSWNKLSKS